MEPRLIMHIGNARPEMFSLRTLGFVKTMDEHVEDRDEERGPQLRFVAVLGQMVETTADLGPAA